jgi:hypothetical protein
MDKMVEEMQAAYDKAAAAIKRIGDRARPDYHGDIILRTALMAVAAELLIAPIKLTDGGRTVVKVDADLEASAKAFLLQEFARLSAQPVPDVPARGGAPRAGEGE